VSTGLLQDSVINGNQGDDFMSIQASDMEGSYFLGGKDNDLIFADSSFISFASSLKNGEVNGNMGDDIINLGEDFGEDSSFSNMYVGGGQGNDILEIVGDFDDSIVDGNKGDDTIDIFAGDHSNTSVNGGEGNDIIRTANSIFSELTSGLVLNGDIGDDTILALGGTGTTVSGGEGNDTIAIGGEDSFLNTVNGGVGADFVALSGEDSRETYIFNQGDSVAATETSFEGTPGIDATLGFDSEITFGDGVDILFGVTEFDKIEFDFSADGLVNINDDELIDSTFANVIYEVQGVWDGVDTFVVDDGEDNFMYIMGGRNLTVGQVFTNSSNIIITDQEFDLIGGDLVVD
jgi:hypothetical protein